MRYRSLICPGAPVISIFSLKIKYDYLKNKEQVSLMTCNLIFFYFLFLIDCINDDISGINLNTKQLKGSLFNGL